MEEHMNDSQSQACKDALYAALKHTFDSGQRESRQISIFTLNEGIREKLFPKSEPAQSIFENIRHLVRTDEISAFRLSPIVPFINDDISELEEIILKAIDCGVDGVIVGTFKLPEHSADLVLDMISMLFPGSSDQIRETYNLEIDGRIYASYEYRHRLFSMLKAICERLNITLSLEGEFSVENGKGGRAEIVDLNRYFGVNCCNLE